MERDWDIGSNPEDRLLRYLILMAATCWLTACASDTDVAMQDPRTGDTTTCGQSFLGLNPWSQTQACVAQHAAQGWVTTSK